MVSDGQLCFIIARVFDDDGDGANWSDILEAVKWTYQKGAKIINMSLGGSSYSETASQVYKNIYSGGSLVVAGKCTEFTGVR